MFKNKLMFSLVLLFLFSTLLFSQQTKETQLITTTMGYHPAIGVENFGMSLAMLNGFSGFGFYFNIFGIGNIASSSAYSYAFLGDELINTYNDESWGAMSYGITYKISKKLYAYAGYCNGMKWILDGATYYDEFHILDPTGYYDVEYSYTESKPGIDLGIYYEVKNWSGFIPLFIVGGFNTSMSTVVIGASIGFSIPIPK
ncbi:MAG: hypothetical protein U9R23_08880 [Candidatus Cloacimonadota bacterium]|nr:hypothetical protein [Candidatus Cloacimonadota bacterium]